MPYTTRLTSSVNQNKVYHWLNIGYTHVICYNNPLSSSLLRNDQPVDQEYLAFCYFPSSATESQVQASIDALKANGMIDVVAYSLQDLLLSY